MSGKLVRKTWQYKPIPGFPRFDAIKYQFIPQRILQTLILLHATNNIHFTAHISGWTERQINGFNKEFDCQFSSEEVDAYLDLMYENFRNMAMSELLASRRLDKVAKNRLVSATRGDRRYDADQHKTTHVSSLALSE